MTDVEERISVRAYFLWEQAGKPKGGAEQFWFEAERQIKGSEDGAYRPDDWKDDTESGALDSVGAPASDRNRAE